MGTAFVAARDYPLLRCLLAILVAAGDGGRAADGSDRTVVVRGGCCGLPVQTQHRLPQEEEVGLPVLRGVTVKLH